MNDRSAPLSAEQHPGGTRGAETGSEAATGQLSGLATEAPVTPPPALTEVGQLRARVAFLEEAVEKSNSLARLGARCFRDCHDGQLAGARAEVEGHRFALSVKLGLGTGAPWDAIYDRVAELHPASETTSSPTTEDLAAADNPTRLRWGLDDVLWGDDDSVIVLMSDEERRPYWLELEADRAAVLRRNLAGPDGEQPADEETGSRPCGHDDYHDPHEWADRPGVWCGGISYADDEAVQA